MRFKNINTAINQELGRIAGVQHRQWGIRNRDRPTPLIFKEWLLQGIRHYENQGFKFELVDRYTMKIVPPGKTAIFRTCADFKDEYENEYLPKISGVGRRIGGTRRGE